MTRAAEVEADPASRVPRVVVVGGGIAGLSAARELLVRRPGWQVVVLESAERVGGKMRLGEVGGAVVDTGAESLLFRRPEAVDLARAVGLGDALEHPATYAARIWSRGARRPLPRSVMGVPGDPASLQDAGLLSPSGLARALEEPDRPPTPEQGLLAAGGDVSVGDLVASRFGDEVVDRLLEPLLGGVYAGRSRDLSVRACTPQVVALTTTGQSLTTAATAVLQAPASSLPVFAGLRGGVGQLPAAVAADVEARGGEVRTGTTVRLVRRTPTGYRLETGPVPAPEVLEADAVVLAVPGAPASRLLADLAPAAAEHLAGVAYASSAVVTLALPTAQLPAMEGSGFLVPPVEGRFVKAATFSSVKWDWVRAAGQTPDRDEMGEVSRESVSLVRVSVGRLGEEQQLQRTDDELVTACLADLAAAVGVPALPEPRDAVVTRWGGGLPQYRPGHLDRVAAVREAVGAAGRLAVCGAAYDGVGIPACVASGTRAAQDLLAQPWAATPGTAGSTGAAQWEP